MHFLSTTKTAALPSLRCGPSLSVRQIPNARSFQSFVPREAFAKVTVGRLNSWRLISAGRESRYVRESRMRYTPVSRHGELIARRLMRL